MIVNLFDGYLEQALEQNGSDYWSFERKRYDAADLAFSCDLPNGRTALCDKIGRGAIWGMAGEFLFDGTYMPVVVECEQGGPTIDIEWDDGRGRARVGHPCHEVRRQPSHPSARHLLRFQDLQRPALDEVA
jgi:hypothetical protein